MEGLGDVDFTKGSSSSYHTDHLNPNDIIDFKKVVYNLHFKILEFCMDGTVSMHP